MYLFSVIIGVFIAVSAVHTSASNGTVSSVTDSIVVSLAPSSPPTTANTLTLPSTIASERLTTINATNDRSIIDAKRPKKYSNDKKDSYKNNGIVKNKHSLFKWNSVNAGEQDSVSYMLNCTETHMIIEVNLTSVEQPFVYLEKLKSFSICRPKIVKNIATFHLSLDDDFYRCGTVKVYDQHTGSQIYYNRVIVESKNSSSPTAIDTKSVYLKCSRPNLARMIARAETGRGKRDTSSPGVGKLVNFTEIDLPDNFMEAEILDFGEPITQRAPYPHLNIKVKRNGQFVNTSLNVAPGTPLEMIIYLDDKSKHVYGLLGSFMKVTDNGPRQREEVIVLNGCSVDPYIFGNFETDDNGDSISAKFRAFKFPESNYVMFAGTVNVCLDKCKAVSCGNDIQAFGRRRRRSVPEDLPKDPNKMFEIEMVTYLQVSYSPVQLDAKKDSLQAVHEQSSEGATLVLPNKEKAPTASKLVKTDEVFQGEARPVSSRYQTNSSSLGARALSLTFVIMFFISVSQFL